MTEIPTDEGKLYLSTAIDLFSRRLLSAAASGHRDAELAGETIKMAAAAHGGKERVTGVIFHSDRGSTYTAHDFTTLGVLSGITSKTRKEAQQTIVKWVADFYNRRRRRHSSCGMRTPIDYETSAANRAA